MTEEIDPTTPQTTGSQSVPVVQPITIGDILEVLAQGLRDFRTAPYFGPCVGGLYTVYPLAAGFAFIAPFIATVCYAVSRSLERNEPISFNAVRGAVWNAARRDLGWMALVTGFSLFIWMDMAALLFFGFLGLNAMSAPELLQEIFTTPMGLLFLVIGNGVGAVIAIAVFSFSVISFPMLFERDTDFVTSMITSVKVFTTNPAAMLAWCGTIAVLIGLSLLSGLVGLVVVLPVLGHASWHLYRRAIKQIS